MITINTAQNNFNNQHSIKFESRIIPTQSLKNTISHTIKNATIYDEEAGYCRSLIKALNAILNDSKDDVIQFEKTENTGILYKSPTGTDIFVNKEKVASNYITEELQCEFELEQYYKTPINEALKDENFMERSIIDFAEERFQKKFYSEELTEQELDLINPMITKMQNLNSRDTLIHNKMLGMAFRIQKKLYENALIQLEKIQNKIFNPNE